MLIPECPCGAMMWDREWGRLYRCRMCGRLKEIAEGE